MEQIDETNKSTNLDTVLGVIGRDKCKILISLRLVHRLSDDRLCQSHTKVVIHCDTTTLFALTLFPIIKFLDVTLKPQIRKLYLRLQVNFININKDYKLENP